MTTLQFLIHLHSYRYRMILNKRLMNILEHCRVLNVTKIKLDKILELSCPLDNVKTNRK